MQLTKRILHELTNGPGTSFEIAAVINRGKYAVQRAIWGLLNRQLIQDIGTTERIIEYVSDRRRCERYFRMTIYRITDKGKQLLEQSKPTHGRSRYNKNGCRCKVCIATMRAVLKRKEARRKQRAESA